MATEFYHLAPVILTDALFFGQQPSCVITGSFANRRTAYLIAEQQMIRQLNTPLLPMQVTGTFMWPSPYETIVLDFSRVHSIDAVRGLAHEDGCSCELTPYAGCGNIRSYYGYIDVRLTAGLLRSQCGCGPGAMYQLEVVYTAGLPTGTAANDLGLHAALSMAAAQALREVVDPGSNEGGPGAPGITSWSAQGYSESRIAPIKTAFGQNALSNFIANLVEHLRLRRPLRL